MKLKALPKMKVLRAFILAEKLDGTLGDARAFKDGAETEVTGDVKDWLVENEFAVEVTETDNVVEDGGINEGPE